MLACAELFLCVPVPSLAAKAADRMGELMILPLRPSLSY